MNLAVVESSESYHLPAPADTTERRPWGVAPARVPCPFHQEMPMATRAQRNRTRLHVLRDNVHRARRDVKMHVPGAKERLKAHVAARLAYAETGK